MKLRCRKENFTATSLNNNRNSTNIIYIYICREIYQKQNGGFPCGFWVSAVASFIYMKIYISPKYM